MTGKVMVAASALALLLAGCGGDDDDAGDEGSNAAQPYLDALVESADDAESGDLQFDEGEAECVAPRWVQTLDPARMEAAGITPNDLAEGEDVISELNLTDAQGGELYDAMVECDIDVRELFLAGMAEDSELSDEDRACLEEAMDDDLVRRAFIAGLTQGEDALAADEDLMGEFFAVFGECPGAIPEE